MPDVLHATTTSYLLRPHRPRDRRPQGGRPPHLRARGLLRPPHPVRLLRQGFRPPRVRIPVIPSRPIRAGAQFIGRTSDRRARSWRIARPRLPGSMRRRLGNHSWTTSSAPRRPGGTRGARPWGAVARDPEALGLEACPPVDRAQARNGRGDTGWRGRTRLIAARRSVIPNISSVPLAPFLRRSRADRARRARPRARDVTRPPIAPERRHRGSSNDPIDRTDRTASSPSSLSLSQCDHPQGSRQPPGRRRCHQEARPLRPRPPRQARQGSWATTTTVTVATTSSTSSRRHPRHHRVRRWPRGDGAHPAR